MNRARFIRRNQKRLWRILIDVDWFSVLGVKSNDELWVRELTKTIEEALTILRANETSKEQRRFDKWQKKKANPKQC